MIAADVGGWQQKSDQPVAEEQQGDELTYTEDDDNEVVQPPPVKRARTGEQTM